MYWCIYWYIGALWGPWGPWGGGTPEHPHGDQEAALVPRTPDHIYIFIYIYIYIYIYKNILILIYINIMFPYSCLLFSYSFLLLFNVLLWPHIPPICLNISPIYLKYTPNHQQIIPKSSKNHSKIIKQSSQNHPKIVPKSFRNLLRKKGGFHKPGFS